MTKPRLLVANNVYPPQIIGGAEIVAQRHARRLAARGYELSIIAGWVPALGGTAEEMAHDGNIPVHRFPFKTWDPDLDFLPPGSSEFFAKVLDQDQPDLVHVHNLRGIGIGLIAAAHRRHLPVVVTLHDYWWHCRWATRLRPDGSICHDATQCGPACSSAVRGLPIRLRRDTLLRALDRAQAIIAPSQALARSYVQAGIPESRITVLSSGINIDAIAASARRPIATAAQPLHFLAVGSLAPHKGLDDLLDAAELLGKDPCLAGRWRLTIAGDGPLRQMLEYQIGYGRFGNTVVYAGQVAHDRIARLFEAADVVVLPSCWPENQPVVLLEGAAAGAALLATDAGGNPELVHPGRGGELVPARDPVSLACAMASYVREPGKAAAHGDWNRARRREMDEARTIDRLEAIYDRVLATARTSAEVPLVLCAGTITDQVATLLNQFHCLERHHGAVRLVWHEWAEPEDWNEAAFFLDLGGAPAARERAILAGLPVVTRQDGTACSGILQYASVLEAAAALTLWAAAPQALHKQQQATRRLTSFCSSSLASVASPDGSDPLHRALSLRTAELEKSHRELANALT